MMPLNSPLGQQPSAAELSCVSVTPMAGCAVSQGHSAAGNNIPAISEGETSALGAMEEACWPLPFDQSTAASLMTSLAMSSSPLLDQVARYLSPLGNGEPTSQRIGGRTASGDPPASEGEPGYVLQSDALAGAPGFEIFVDGSDIEPCPNKRKVEPLTAGGLPRALDNCKPKAKTKTSRARVVDLSPDLIHRCPYEGCRKKFAKKYNLKIHVRRHTGELPFLCQVPNCGKRFMWHSSFVRHQKSHERRPKGPRKSTSGTFETELDPVSHQLGSVSNALPVDTSGYIPSSDHYKRPAAEATQYHEFVRQLDAVGNSLAPNSFAFDARARGIRQVEKLPASSFQLQFSPLSRESISQTFPTTSLATGNVSPVSAMTVLTSAQSQLESPPSTTAILNASVSRPFSGNVHCSKNNEHCDERVENGSNGMFASDMDCGAFDASYFIGYR